jgi:hypothetical protein
MLAQTRRRGRFAALILTAAATVLASSAACDKVPLLAPTGSVITLFPASTTVPINGEIEIVATVIENGTTTAPSTGGGAAPGTPSTTPTTTTSTAGAGTPVQNGTVVSFTTTIGRIEPREARTNNGEVRVKFIAGGQSGVATITAYSGGASGKLENLRVGSAAVERVTLTANPQTLGPSGGATVVSAHVQDVSGLGVSGIPVDFTADAGQLSAPSALTDQNGIASITLTTSRQSKVTANVAGKTADVTVGLNPRTGITLAGPTTSVAAGTPATFTVGVGSTANIRDVVIDFGDSRTQSLGAISGSTTVAHTYTEAGTYTVTATATDSSGFSEPVRTTVTVLPAQPPSVIVTPSNSSPSVNETIIVTATVSGNTSTIIGYDWNFGSGASPQTAHTSGNRVSVSWSTSGTKVITVTATQSSGPSGDGIAAVTVRGTPIR